MLYKFHKRVSVENQTFLSHMVTQLKNVSNKTMFNKKKEFLRKKYRHKVTEPIANANESVAV